MGTLWIIYWISVFVVILICTITKRFFVVDGKSVKRLYVLLICAVSFIPAIGSIEAMLAIGFLFTGICEGDIKPKEQPFSNEKLNDFFLN